MTQRGRGARVALLASLGLGLIAAQAHAEPCAPPPTESTGYQVTAVGGDKVAPPPTTPPIAVLDSGVSEVPELAGRLLPGVNVVSPGATAEDLDGHGTAVATVAAGAPGALRGIATTARVLPVKILDASGETTAASVVAGIQAAVARGARVINLSAAAPSGPLTSDDRKVMTAIGRAFARGVVVIAPSGNEGATKLDIPASYPHVLSVGATDESGLRADFSNSGFGLDMAAPGADIWSAAPTSVCPSGYTYSSGTSFAAPAVSGAAALLAALRPDLDASQVIEMLRRGAGQSAWSPGLGFGLLNIPAVLAAPVPPAQPREVDDDVYWVKRAPLSLSPKRRRTSVDGSVAARLDPTDVYPVQLRAGDILRASVNSAGAPLRLGLWDRRTGSFDITDGRLQHRVSSGPVLRRRVRKGGTYYVSVAAPAKSPVTTPYKLSLSR